MYSKSVMLTLLALLAVCNALNISADPTHNVSFYGEEAEKKMEKIVDGIDKTSGALKEIQKVINSNKTVDLKSALKVVEEFSKLGAVVFPQFKAFSSSMALLNGLIDGGTTPDDKIEKGLNEIKEEIKNVEVMINGLTPQIRNELIKQRFVNIQHKVNDLQKVYDEFTNHQGKIEKNMLNRTCDDKKMKNVLTQLHFEIAKGGVNTFNALLDGHRNEMQDALNWHKVFQSLYIQASTLQAVCIPLMFSGGDVNRYVEEQNKIAQKDYQKINDVFKGKLDKMKNKFDSNAKKALKSWFDENWTNNGKEMMNKTYWYLNDNFNPGNGVKWNVITVGIKSLDDFNYYDKTLIAKNKDGITLLADYGKLTKPFRCDEDWLFNQKKLQCIRIKGKHIHWFLHRGVPDFWDSSEFDGYGPDVHKDVTLPPPRPIIPG